MLFQKVSAASSCWRQQLSWANPSPWEHRSCSELNLERMCDSLENRHPPDGFGQSPALSPSLAAGSLRNSWCGETQLQGLCAACSGFTLRTIMICEIFSSSSLVRRCVCVFTSSSQRFAVTLLLWGFFFFFTFILHILNLPILSSFFFSSVPWLFFSFSTWGISDTCTCSFGRKQSSSRVCLWDGLEVQVPPCCPGSQCPLLQNKTQLCYCLVLLNSHTWRRIMFFITAHSQCRRSMNFLSSWMTHRTYFLGCFPSMQLL